MLTLYDHLPRFPETLQGCRMATLAAAYRHTALAPSFYRGDNGTLLCRWGETALVAGELSPSLLCEAAGWMGLTAIEMVSPSPQPIPGFSHRSYPVLETARGDFPFHPAVPAEDGRRIFAILQAADPQFSASYDEWRSDLRSRQRVGQGFSLLLEDAATAAILAQGRHTAYLGSVATLPARQGEGLASRAVQQAVAVLPLSVRTVYTVAATPALVDFYRRLGFRERLSPLVQYQSRGEN